MEQHWKNKWDERFGQEEYAYGELPNNFLKEQIDRLKLGRILFPAEGEGRNAVYAATLGWQVSAFDTSTEGQKKALKLAQKNNVTIDYIISDLQTLSYHPNQFDAIGLIYAHFPADIKQLYYQTLSQYLCSGGTVILEGFSKKHIGYNSINEKVGGPKDIEMLFSTAEIVACFPNYTIDILEEVEVELNEGLYHNGKGSVIRFVGRKK
ncbi:MAG: class I SAM-dependent methyltransferase [Bacteroidia bacterium]|nr:class I SAM-dependent methyltransferase [Bacteroidia bacterium]